MLDLPPVLPADYPAPAALVETCTAQAAEHFKLPVLVVRAVAKVEGGKVGTVSRNKNGSVDLGIMQINSIHLPMLQKKFGVTWRDLAYKPCVNIGIGAWILAREIREAPDFWTGVGNYHSRTPKFHNRYKGLVARAYERLLSDAKKRLAQVRSKQLAELAQEQQAKARAAKAQPQSAEPKQEGKKGV